MQFEYRKRTKQKLINSYNRRVNQNLNGFTNFEDFHKWYNDQELVCYYCGLKEIESQKLVMTGLLKSNRFPQNGIIGRGQNRAVWLEVDRLNPKELYTKDNCVMCCYFCNNDKSDVFGGNEYTNFFQNRVDYLRQILKDNPQNE